MKFTKDAFISGTSFKGDFYAYYHEIVEIFEDTILEFGLNVIRVSGSVRQRVNIILNTIGELND